MKMQRLCEEVQNKEPETLTLLEVCLTSQVSQRLHMPADLAVPFLAAAEDCNSVPLGVAGQVLMSSS